MSEQAGTLFEEAAEVTRRAIDIAEGPADEDVNELAELVHRLAWIVACHVGTDQELRGFLGDGATLQ